MNMGFSISNLTIIAMTVIVVFCKQELDWEKLAVYEGHEEFKVCIDGLSDLDFYTGDSGIAVFKSFVPNLYSAPRNMKMDFAVYINFAKGIIDKKFNAVFDLTQFSLYGHPNDGTSSVDDSLARLVAYYFGLALNILYPEYMLTVATWCQIHAKGTYNSDEFLNKNATVETDHRQYLSRIAKSTGLSRKKQTLVYRTIDEITKDKNTKQRTNLSGVELYFEKMYLSNTENTGFTPSPLNWCAIDVCFHTLINAGFLDVSAEQNIQEVMLPTFKIKEKNGYIYDFYQYLKNLQKRPTVDSQGVNFNDSQIEIQVGYLRNWCGVQVCHADLLEQGYKYEHVTDNYYHVKSSKLKKTSKFVTDFREYLVFTVTMENTYRYSEYFSLEDEIYDIPANGSPKSPLNWCKYHVVPYKKNVRDNET